MSGLSALRILIVDDNAQMRAIVGSVLGAVGIHDRHYGSNGAHGFHVACQIQPDVIFCDYEMPRANGLEFLARIRRRVEPHCYTPVIMLTGHSDLRCLQTARDLGVTEFLTKPVSAEKILKRLEAVILRPRHFVRSANYFGPDRRRRVDPIAKLQARRSSDVQPVFEV